MSKTVNMLNILPMMFWTICASILFAMAHDAENCKYVTFPMCGEGRSTLEVDTNIRTKGDLGSPGKAGPRGNVGPKGEKGNVGQKGEPVSEMVIANMIDEELKELVSLLVDEIGTDICRQSNKSGVISFHGNQFVCDGNSWTVVQSRQDGSIDFERSWEEYKNGFGELNGEFWIGLQTIHRMTRGKTCSARFELESFNGEDAYAEYSTFSVANEDKQFKLSITGYSGTAGDSMAMHNDMDFSTIDRDNDKNADRCSNGVRGGWWFNNCFHVVLNAQWGRSTGKWHNIIWYGWKKETEALRGTKMKTRC